MGQFNEMDKDSQPRNPDDRHQPDSGEPELLDPPLTTEQARVIGCLIEKESTTPEAYPLTLNAAVTACNQKTSRNPVMKLDPGRVGQTLRQLEQRGLIDSEYGARAERYRHRIDEALKLTAGQRVLLGLLLLRGAQTLSELFARSERMHRFDDLDEVRFQLERMATHSPALTIRIPRGPGQREDRWMHLLVGPVDISAPPAPTRSAAESDPDTEALIERIEALEARVEALEQQLS